MEKRKKTTSSTPEEGLEEYMKSPPKRARLTNEAMAARGFLSAVAKKKNEQKKKTSSMKSSVSNPAEWGPRGRKTNLVSPNESISNKRMDTKKAKIEIRGRQRIETTANPSRVREGGSQAERPLQIGYQHAPPLKKFFKTPPLPTPTKKLKPVKAVTKQKKPSPPQRHN